MVLCLAGSAMAVITSAQTGFTVDPSDPTKVQVYSSYSQDPAGENITVANFIMPRWDATCSEAGYLSYNGGAPPTADIAEPDYSGFDSNIYEHISDITGNPVGVPTCIGTVAYDYSQTDVAVDAKPGYYNKPYVNFNYDDSSTNSTISIGLEITPNWLATNYNVSYFKRVNTANCNSPDLGDLLTAVTTTSAAITTDLKQDHPVTVEITGLERETDYCVSFHADNAAGSEDTLYWGYYTSGDPPVIDDQDFSPAVSGINYDVDVTPGITTSDALVSIEYFEKSGATCVEPVGGPSSHTVYYDNGGVGLRGFSSINLADTLAGLSAGTQYCVRAYVYSAAGEDDSQPYETVTTIDKTAATVDSTSITQSDEPGSPVDIHATFNDHGANLDTGNTSNYTYDIFPLEPSEQCDENATYGGPGDVANGGGGFLGMDSDFELPLNEFERGQRYCAIFQLDSAWGNSYNGTHYFAYWGGTAPSISETSASADHTTINILSTIDAGYLATGWGALSFALNGDETCDDGPHVNSPVYSGADALAEGTIPSSDVSFPLTGMIPNADYCVKIVAENLMGSDESAWVPVSTGDEFDTEAPSAPTGLAASNITQTSATLSWTAATDNVAVTRYDVIDGTLGLVGSTASASKSVALTCGQASQFHVIAFDADGNESEKSDTIDITGAACDVPPPPPIGGGNTTPPAKQCVNPFKKKSVKGKSGKKKATLAVSGKVASDGQSVVITAKSKAKVTFKVDGKKVTAKNGSITVKKNPSLVTVSMKVGSKTKTIKVQTSVSAC